MQEFILKPKNYTTWSNTAIAKIHKTIESCENELHLKGAKKMIDNFIIILAINDESDSETVHQISRQLWLTYKLKENQINVAV